MSPCTVEGIGDSAAILSVGDDGGLLLARDVYIDGSGVHGEALTIDTDCSLQRAPMVQPPMTAFHRLEDGRSLVALGPLVGAGPEQRRQGPCSRLATVMPSSTKRLPFETVQRSTAWLP